MVSSRIRCGPTGPFRTISNSRGILILDTALEEGDFNSMGCALNLESHGLRTILD